jgi:enoyl-CoA hydratase/carnithine racemase
MLFSCDEIDAERALREGIIHKILPVEHFEELCMEQVEKLCSLPNNVVKATKFLLYDLEEELERNFERERRFIDINE